MKQLYCIDTSSVIDAGERFYPIDVFPGFWDKMDALVTKGRLKAPPTLIDELEQKSDAWRDWVYDRKQSMIWTMDLSITSAMKKVMPVYIDGVKNLDSIKGDPFFVAASLANNVTLITSEAPRKGGVKIPKVCDKLGVKWCTLLGMVREEGWIF